MPQPPIIPSSGLTVGLLVAQQQAHLGLTNLELAQELGFAAGNVVAMIKHGKMRLPVPKVLKMAKALKLDPVFLLEKVIKESGDEDLWTLLQSALQANGLITQNEMRLLEFIRSTLDGVEIDLLAPPILQALMPAITDLKRAKVRADQLARAMFTASANQRNGRKSEG